MVAAVRRGESARAVARRFGVSTSTVVYWVERARGHRLDRVDWADRSRAPRHTRRTNAAVEDLILRVRRQLRQDSDLGAFGAEALHQALVEQGVQDVPAVRTINRTPLRPVRQRHVLPGHAPLPRCAGAGHPGLLEPEGCAGVRPAPRAGVPGGHRELQRLVAGQGMAAVPAPLGGGPVRALGTACRGPATAPGGADRGSAWAAAVPDGLGVGPASEAARAADLPAADRRAGAGGGAGPSLAGVGNLAASAGPCGGGPEPGPPSLLHPATTRAQEPADGPGSAVPTAPEGVPGVIGMYWHLSCCTHASVRDVLALTP